MQFWQSRTSEGKWVNHRLRDEINTSALTESQSAAVMFARGRSKTFRRFGLTSSINETLKPEPCPSSSAGLGSHQTYICLHQPHHPPRGSGALASGAARETAAQTPAYHLPDQPGSSRCKACRSWDRSYEITNLTVQNFYLIKSTQSRPWSWRGDWLNR